VRIALLLLVCAALTACGTSSRHELSKSEYARRADALCARYQRLASPPFPATTTRQLARAANRTLRLLDTTVSKLRALRPPRDEQQLAKRWLATLSRLRFDVLQLRERAEANDLAGIHAIIAPAQQHDRASLRLAARLGMHVCSRPAD
jgi:hypothetical protein